MVGSKPEKSDVPIFFVSLIYETASCTLRQYQYDFLLLAPGVLTVSLKLQVIVIVSCPSFSGALSEELYSSQFSCED